MSDIETLGQAWNAGWRIKARCPVGRIDLGKASRKCDWNYELDVMTLVATRGRDFPVMRMADVLRCPRCGCRKIAIMLVLPSNGNRQAAAR